MATKSAAIDVGWTSEQWPPEKEAKGPGLRFTGVIVGLPRKLECRREIQKGFLASKKTADLSAKFTELTLQVTDAKVFAQIKQSCVSFANFVPGSRFFPKDGILLCWASPTIVSDLAVSSSVPDPLMVEGDTVMVELLGGTLLCKSVEVLSLAKRTGKMSIMGETHMYGVVQGGPVQVDSKGGMTEKIFAVKAQMKTPDPPKRSANSDVKEEEWD
jgi:hypothetical protein